MLCSSSLRPLPKPPKRRRRWRGCCRRSRASFCKPAASENRPQLRLRPGVCQHVIVTEVGCADTEGLFQGRVHSTHRSIRIKDRDQQRRVSVGDRRWRDAEHRDRGDSELGRSLQLDASLDQRSGVCSRRIRRSQCWPTRTQILPGKIRTITFVTEPRGRQGSSSRNHTVRYARAFLSFLLSVCRCDIFVRSLPLRRNGHCTVR